MGRRGYVQVRQPKYGSCISDWAQASFLRYLEKHGLSVETNDEWANAEDADHWEIQIPYRKGRVGKSPSHDYAKVRAVIADLLVHPGQVKSYDGDGEHGEAAARVLEEGLKAAIREGSDYIVVEWF